MSTTTFPQLDERMALTYQEAAAQLGVSARTVFALVKSRRLRAARFGRTVRIRRAELERFLQEREAAYMEGRP